MIPESQKQETVFANILRILGCSKLGHLRLCCRNFTKSELRPAHAPFRIRPKSFTSVLACGTCADEHR